MSRVSCMSCVRTAAAILFSMRKKRPAEGTSAGEKAFQNITNITNITKFCSEKRCQRKSAGKLL